MDKKVIDLTEKISKELKKKRKSLKLDELLFNAENDPEIIALKSEIDENIKNIEELQRFYSFESAEIKEKYSNISKLKEKMFLNKNFKRYNEALKKYNSYIDLINKEIFSS